MKKIRLSRNPYGRMKAIPDPKTPKTFLELLESGKELDCELVVGSVDMPLSFVWNEDDRISGYGIEKYRPLMEAPIHRLPNGNIELLCDDWRMGEEFCMAAAGYIGDAEYRRVFEIDGGAEQ